MLQIKRKKIHIPTIIHVHFAIHNKLGIKKIAPLKKDILRKS
jgi:hypothetical protein